MGRGRRIIKGSTKRGILARPLDALIFLLPMILFYEIMYAARQDRVIAFALLEAFFNNFGRIGVWGPGIAAVAILLATHIASGERWVVHWREVGFMYLEAAALAVPLLVVNWAMPLTSAESRAASMFERLAEGVGAGIYEELVFRLILITVIVIVGVDLLKLAAGKVAFVAVVASAVLFAAHHHPPFGIEPYSFSKLLFRTIAGGYLASVFWFRGYGPAAGCHAAYNIVLILLGAM